MPTTARIAASLEGTADRPVPAGDLWRILRNPGGILWFASDSGLYRLGAADYFTRPIDWARLNNTLRRYRQATNHQTVRVVEDEDQTRDLLQRSLAKENWQVVEVENGKVALAKLNGLGLGLEGARPRGGSPKPEHTAQA